jgi:hypothetical protein
MAVAGAESGCGSTCCMVWKTTSFIGALTLRGFIAPFVLDGPNNGDASETHVAKVLVPELRPDAILVMDNLSSHKGLRVSELTEGRGREPATCRPAHPTSNQSKTLRQAQGAAAQGLRTIHRRPVERICRLIDQFPPAECAKDFNAAGYAPA